MPDSRNYYSSSGVFLHKLYAVAIIRSLRTRDRQEVLDCLGLKTA